MQYHTVTALKALEKLNSWEAKEVIIPEFDVPPVPTEPQVFFVDIPKAIEFACEKHKRDLKQKPSLNEILYFDKWARKYVKEIIEKF